MVLRGLPSELPFCPSPLVSRSAPRPEAEQAAPATPGSVDWDQRRAGRASHLLIGLEGATLRIERALRAVVRRPELNPVYHVGTITIYLLGIVFVSGIYLTMFFQFGFDASYDAVAALESNLVGRFMRAVHRYASIGSIVTAAVHGWRTFVMRRFDGPRRMPWATGVFTVAVLWVIGVTGYWLIWDERAQVLNDALTRALQGTTVGLDFLIDNVLTDTAGAGWAFILMLITVHVGLSLGVGGLLWYHLRRLSRRHWLPPPMWLWIVGGTMVVLSIAIPVGMLAPLDRHLLPGSIPVDPFFLFLLPGTLSWPPAVLWPAATALLALVVFLPWVVRVRELPAVVVDEERCIGCTYCVIDCPYRALEMVPRDDGPHQQLAVVTPELCVSCGICIGSCPTQALALGDAPAEPLWAQAAAGKGRPVAFVCERHAEHGSRRLAWSDDPGGPDVIPVPCVGMVHPQLAAHALEAGATDVTLAGCPADDCANLEGNVWLEQRLHRERRPRLKRAYADAPIITAWVPPDTSVDAVSATDVAAPATIRDAMPPGGWRRFAGPTALALIVGLATVLVTMVPFDPGGNDEARIEIALDHRDGVPLALIPGDGVAAGAPSRLIVIVDGDEVFDTTYSFVNADGPETSLAFERIAVEAGDHDVTVTLDAGDTTRTVFDDTVALAAGQVLTIDILDTQAVPKAEAGRSLYFETTIGTNTGCRICHSLDDNVTIVGPSLGGIGATAATRIPGMSAEDYLRESILDPDAFIVEGFPAGQMIPTYLDLLTTEDIDNLVAFLLTQ